MENIWDNKELIETLKNGGVALIPTDTLYGVVGQALNIKTVERIYDLRKKISGKPCLVLIGDRKELENFSIVLTDKQENEINKYWPGPVTIILDSLDPKFQYLARDMNTLAFRVPKNQGLKELLKKVGPLIAPSANTEGMPPAKNISEAQNYFGDAVDFYLDGGEVDGSPSRIIKLDKDGNVSVIRP